MNEFRYDTFEDYSEMDEMVKRNRDKSILYMSMPDQWNLSVADYSRKEKLEALIV